MMTVAEYIGWETDELRPVSLEIRRRSSFVISDTYRTIRPLQWKKGHHQLCDRYLAKENLSIKRPLKPIYYYEGFFAFLVRLSLNEWIHYSSMIILMHCLAFLAFFLASIPPSWQKVTTTTSAAVLLLLTGFFPSNPKVLTNRQNETQQRIFCWCYKMAKFVIFLLEKIVKMKRVNFTYFKYTFFF